MELALSLQEKLQYYEELVADKNEIIDKLKQKFIELQDAHEQKWSGDASSRELAIRRESQATIEDLKGKLMAAEQTVSVTGTQE